MNKTEAKKIGREQRHKRIRARISGTAARPRLAVYRSNRYLHAQIIDDTAGKTLIAGSTQNMVREKKTDAAKKLGEDLAIRAKAAGISSVVFDRGGFRYSGGVASFAEAARAGGLTF